MKQINHDDFISNTHDKEIIFICCSLQSPSNLGSICRVAEAFGVSKLYIHEENLSFLNLPRFVKTARHSHRNITKRSFTNLEQLIIELKKKQTKCMALEYCDKSESIVSLKATGKIALVVGNEKYGIDKTVLDMVDGVFHIDMYGKNSSMNVSQASAIALYQLVNHCK